LTDHHKALDYFDLLLKIKEKRLKTRENLEVCNALFDVARQTNFIGKKDDALKIYQEVLGK
jgi:hypothetical protein